MISARGWLVALIKIHSSTCYIMASQVTPSAVPMMRAVRVQCDAGSAHCKGNTPLDGSQPPGNKVLRCAQATSPLTTGAQNRFGLDA